MNGYQQHLGVPRDQSRPERQSSPLRIKDLSGLTGSNIRQTTNSKFRDEEEEYERRRQDELRKQMQRDSEGPQVYSQATRSNYNTGDMYTSGKSYQSGPAERDKPSSTHFTLGPSLPVAEPSSQEAPPHIREHMANIQSDNQSLMRRLNLVIQELDRVNKEKDDVYLRLKESSNHVSDLQNLINSEDNVDKTNKYMSDDLIYERDRNHKLKSKIKELDLYRNELIHELRKLQESQDDIAKENQQMTYSLQQKLTMIQDIEKEHYFTTEKIKQASNSIESLKLEMMDENAEKLDLQKILSQLIVERNDLLNRLEHLTRKYDECVRDISHDRADMERHNKQHAKLITAKIIFQQLEQIQRSRKATGYQEFKQYCSFDKKCHEKLQKFAKVLEKMGHFRMRRGLRTWFSKALDPIKMRKQSMMLAIKADDSRLKYKMLLHWKNLYQRRIDQYDLKTKAIQQIWHLYQKDSAIELKRSFQIWKEVQSSFKMKQTRVKKLVWRLYFNKLNIAFNTWTNYSSSFDNQVRLNLLSKEFSQKQYLTILFHNFKYQVTEAKRKRFNILFHCLKSWKDHLAYQKFLMGTNVAALHFRKNCDSTIMKQCFDAFRIHKEQEKYIKLHQILHEEELPLIDSLQNETEDIEVQKKFKAKNKACESVKKMMSKQLYGYFLQWKEVSDNYKDTLKTTIKDKIIKFYMQQIRQAFTYWKTLHDGNKILAQEMVISEFSEEHKALTNEVLDLQKELKSREEHRDCSQQKQVLKCVTSYQRRMKELAIARWRDCVTETTIKEDGAETIVRRLRLRFLRKAFDLYAAGVKYKKKLLIEEERCALYHKTRNERLKRTVMNAWLIFQANHKRAKKYWYRLHLSLDISLKQQAMKRWQEFAQKAAERELLEQQRQIVDKIEDLNHNIGELHQVEIEQLTNLKDMKNQLTKQAQRIISNAFARFYYTNETRGFEKWKEFVELEKRKERILKKTLDHWKKYQFYFVKSSFQNWILNANINERREQLKKEEMRAADASFQLDQQTKQFSVMKAKLANEMDEIKKLQSMYSDRLQKSISMIIKKVDNNDFMSQKRYILTQWRDYVKREVNFIRCIQNVIQKSLWSKAFTQIRQFSREVRDDRNKEDVLNMFRLKFWKRTCGNAFSVWRSGAFSMVSQTIEEVDQVTQQTVEEHDNKKAVFKQVNKERSGKTIVKSHLRNLFQSWKNVTQFLKLQNSKDEMFQESTKAFQIKMALWKWQQRKNATKLARLRYKRLKEKFHTIRLRLYFNALRNQFDITKEFCTRMSNLAHIHNHQGLKLSFNAIISFAKAKAYVHETRKSNASKNIESILTSLVLRKKHQHWRDFRLRSMLSKRESLLKSFTILHNIGNKMRHFFLKWKEGASERSLAKEMLEEGPIREEVFEIKAQLKNLRSLMEQEGYDEKEIQAALNEEKSRQAQSILKAVRRMQHYNEEMYPKPKAFDRWRQYVHMRKLFKYWLGFAAKRGEYVKSDLHYAFDKWKNYYNDQFQQLSKLSKDQLEQRLLKNNKGLDHIAEEIEDKENTLGHLENQREALVENYIKGQKLALSLWLNYRRKTLHQAFLRWCKKIKTDKNNQTVDSLRRNLELIENLKSKIADLESNNEDLANENEELRQFSLDGYEIAKNVQALTAERENLSVDLADKAQIIRKLLDENEKLTSKLRKAQDEAQNLIRSTMAGSSGFKSGMKTGISPLTKSSQY